MSNAALAEPPPSASPAPPRSAPGAWFEEVPLVIPACAAEFEGFLDWAAADEFPPGLKASFFDHRLYLEHTVGDADTHGDLKDEIVRVLRNLAKRDRIGRAFGDGTLFVHRANGLGNEPDCLFCTTDTLNSGRARVVERRPGVGGPMTVQGTPDLMVEVVSRSSVEKDTVTLRREYFAAGVREYWILDGRDEPHAFDLLTRVGREADWAEAAADADGFRLSPVLGRRVRLDRGVAPGGGVEWDLRSQP